MSPEIPIARPESPLTPSSSSAYWLPGSRLYPVPPSFLPSFLPWPLLKSTTNHGHLLRFRSSSIYVAFIGIDCTINLGHLLVWRNRDIFHGTPLRMVWMRGYTFQAGQIGKLMSAILYLLCTGISLMYFPHSVSHIICDIVHS